ncbi:MAG: hypothetical protein EOO40_00860 [Deltaproteobacteria bacterium]|nr:MAG: hypothetical protein EOO40_00860 [Deltaproteobacteria bacterium]
MTDKTKVSLEVVCTLCGSTGAEQGCFTLQKDSYTTFAARPAEGQLLTGDVCCKAGALCDTCNPDDYAWLYDVPKGAQGVLQDMVARNFVDSFLAERYLAGLATHRRLDPSVRMMPSEGTLWYTAQSRALADVLSYVRESGVSVKSIEGYVQAYQLQLQYRQGELEMDKQHAERDNRLIVSAKRKKGC